MRALTYSFIWIALLIMVFSCTDLNVTHYDEVTNQNFEPTKENLDRLVLPVYTDLRWEFAMEGHRRQNLFRFGEFTRKSWFTKESGRRAKPFSRSRKMHWKKIQI